MTVGFYPKLTIPPIYLGCDPEFFFATKAGKVVGAEKVLTKVLTADTYSDHVRNATGTTQRALMVDGVQVELNPRPHACRANLGVELAAAFRALKAHLATMKDVEVSFNTVVEVSKEELDSLSDQAKVFGCAPSLNAYDKAAAITVDPTTYLKRSAGGHVHLGLGAGPTMTQRERLVPILDTILGNTCVLIDRDPEAPERRKVYGRAGEYRLPAHGLEYRTLSNFWLQAYPLMHLVMGLTKLAHGVLWTTLTNYSPWNAEEALMTALGPGGLERIREAINSNDLSLAKENYRKVKTFIQRHVFEGTQCSLNPNTLGAFDTFIKGIEEKGLKAWFPTDPLTHWCALTDGHGRGSEAFLGTLSVTPPSGIAGIP